MPGYMSSICAGQLSSFFTSLQYTNEFQSAATAARFPTIIVSTSDLLEDRVNEGRQRRPLREHEERTDQEHHHEDRQQPPLLAHAHECPELLRQTSAAHNASLEF